MPLPGMERLRTGKNNLCTRWKYFSTTLSQAIKKLKEQVAEFAQNFKLWRRKFSQERIFSFFRKKLCQGEILKKSGKNERINKRKILAGSLRSKP